MFHYEANIHLQIKLIRVKHGTIHLKKKINLSMLNLLSEM